jgi:hypothetical protein
VGRYGRKPAPVLSANVVLKAADGQSAAVRVVAGLQPRDVVVVLGAHGLGHDVSDRVDALGGTIEIHSPTGGRTTPRVRLPIARSSAITRTEATPHSQSHASLGFGWQVAAMTRGPPAVIVSTMLLERRSVVVVGVPVRRVSSAC